MPHTWNIDDVEMMFPFQAKSFHAGDETSLPNQATQALYTLRVCFPHSVE